MRRRSDAGWARMLQRPGSLSRIGTELNVEMFLAAAGSVVLLGWVAVWLALSAIFVGSDRAGVRQESRHGNG